jgi:HlyD family secretion protein
MTTLLVGALVAGAGGYAWYRMHHTTPIAYVTTEAKRGRLEAKVTATGTVSPLIQVLVGSQISGQISKLYADWNSKVKKGEVIARLDTALLEANVAQCKANLLAAEGNLAKAKAQAFDATHQATRSSELLAKKLVAQADTDTAQATALADDAAVKAAEGQLAQTKSALDQAKINLAYATIYSPINGVVISRSVDVGQTVAAAMSAPTLFTIAESLEKMQVDTSVAESDVGKISTGMEATFTVDAYPGERFRGTVRQVRNSPTTVQNVVTYDAVVDVPNVELKLKPGMTANVSFVYAQRKDVLKIPSAALRFQPADQMPAASKSEGERGERGEKGKGRHRPGANDPRTVWVLRDGKAVAASIHVGITDSASVEVIDGLNEGDQVITDTLDTETKKGPSGPGGRRPF